jgi:hypothetical protein
MSEPASVPPRRHAGLVAVLAVFLLLATAFNVVVPVFEHPDETTHFFMAQHIAQTGQLPVQPADENLRGPWEQQGSQPPLYYLLAAPLVRLAGSNLATDGLWYNDQNTMGMPALVGNENRFIHDPAVEGWPWRGHVLAVHLARLLSTLMGLVTVFCVWCVAGHVFRTRPLLALAATALVAFNPQFLAVSAALSNDPAVIMLATAALALTLRVAAGHDDWVTVLALAAAAGLAPLAKLSGLAVLGFVVLSLAVLAWRRRDWRWLARTAGPVLGVALVASGWWYWRNFALYGDVTGLNRMHPGGTRRHESLAKWLRGLPDELKGVWFSSWGLFGWFTVMLPGWLYTAVTAVTVAALGGLIVAWRRRMDWLAWPVLGWLALWGAIVFASLLNWIAYTKGGQGRLMFPALALFGAVLVAGWRALVPARLGDRALALTVGGAMVAMSVLSLFGVIRPAYALAPRIPESAIPADAERLENVVFDGKLQLVAIQHPDRVVEGGQLPVTLYWRVLAPIERDGLVGLRVDQTPRNVLGAPGMPPSETVVSGPVRLAHPGNGTTPLRLMPPQDGVYVDRQWLTAPELATTDQPPPMMIVTWPYGVAHPHALPALARLSVQVFDTDGQAKWPLDGSSAADEWAADVAVVPRAPLPVRGQAPVLARFGNGVELYGAICWACPLEALGDWPSSFAWELDATSAPFLRLPYSTDFLWRTTRPVDEDLTAFVHIVDAAGHTVAQSDSPPATYGRYPTSRWRPGEWLAGFLPDRPMPVTGRGYRMLIGLYRPSDGSRVAAFRADGSRWTDDAAVIEEFHPQ